MNPFVRSIKKSHVLVQIKTIKFAGVIPETKGAFNWEYKKQGPPEWTVAITKLPPQENSTLEQLLKREKLKEALKLFPIE